jgi:hypothetical protein
MPAFDDIDKLATSKELDNINGMFSLLSTDGFGSHGLSTKLFVPFIGADARDGMAEFRRKANQGIRILCFRRPGKEILLATAFEKPPQRETPPNEKARARQVLASHERRLRSH